MLCSHLWVSYRDLVGYCENKMLGCWPDLAGSYVLAVFVFNSILLNSLNWGG